MTIKRSFDWIASHRIFADQEMGAPHYEQSVVTLAQ